MILTKPQATNTSGADTITFDATSMSGATINLGGTELAITEALTIDAAPLAQNVTINAQQQSRILHITAVSGDFTLDGLTLAGGQTTGDNFRFPSSTTHNGGAIRSTTSGLLTLEESTVSGNGTTGANAHGGGIFAAGPVSLIQSTMSGNTTQIVRSGRGGGIAATAVALTQSSVSGNSSNLGGGAATAWDSARSRSEIAESGLGSYESHRLCRWTPPRHFPAASQTLLQPRRVNRQRVVSQC